MLIQRPDRNHMEVDVVKHVPAGFWVKTVNANDVRAGKSAYSTPDIPSTRRLMLD